MPTDPTPTEGAPTKLSPNALERRVKRWLLSGPFDCFVQVAPGLEDTLAGELSSLGLVSGADEIRIARGGVELKLDHEGIMRANLGLRTAGRVLLRLGTFPAASREMLYDRARKIDWEVQLGFSPGYRLRLSSKNSKLQAGDEVTDALSGAISRHMRELGLYPKIDEESPLEFHVRLLDDRCTVSLNTSGEHLHRRGMRTHVGAAPLRETLAAAMAIEGLGDSAAEASTQPPELIVDPFCGSGTLLIEAVDLLSGLPPGRQRAFAFERAAWFRPGRWREVQRSVGQRGASEASSPTPGPQATNSPATGSPATRFLGIDSDPTVLEAARSNLLSSGHLNVELVTADSTSFDFAALGAPRGLVLANLPYGVRLGERREAAALTRRFLDHLAASGGSWRAVLLVHDPEPVTGHEAFAVTTLKATSNGGLPVTMIAGSVVVGGVDGGKVAAAK